MLSVYVSQFSVVLEKSTRASFHLDFPDGSMPAFLALVSITIALTVVCQRS